jgi:hypothetical protein
MTPPKLHAPTSPEAEPHLPTVAYEAQQQAKRIRALVQALAKAAGQGTDEELWFEALERLLDPLCEWTSTLCFELMEVPQTDKATQEVQS